MVWVDKMNNKKLLLRPLEKGDINQRYLGWLNDREVTKYMITASPVSMEELKQYIYRTSDRHMIFAIIIDKVHIGTITLNRMDDEIPFIGVMIGEKDYWGQGYATEAIKQLIELVLGMGYTKIWTRVTKENIASYKAFIKAGFHITGFYTTVIKDDAFRLDWIAES